MEQSQGRKVLREEKVADDRRLEWTVGTGLPESSSDRQKILRHLPRFLEQMLQEEKILVVVMSLEEEGQDPNRNGKGLQCVGTGDPWIQNDPRFHDHHWSWPDLHSTINHWRRHSLLHPTFSLHLLSQFLAGRIRRKRLDVDFVALSCYLYRTRNPRHGHSTHVLPVSVLGSSMTKPVDGTFGAAKTVSGAAAEEVQVAVNDEAERGDDVGL